MATIQTRAETQKVIDELRIQASALSGIGFLQLKAKLSELVSSLETLQTGDRATPRQREQVLAALDAVESDATFPKSNGVRELVDTVKSFRRLHGTGGFAKVSKATVAADDLAAPAAAEKIERVDAIMDKIRAIRSEMTAGNSDQDIFDLTGNLLSIAGPWTRNQKKFAQQGLEAKEQDVTKSNTLLGEAIWNLKLAGEDKLQAAGLSTLLSELMTLHPAIKPEQELSRGTSYDLGASKPAPTEKTAADEPVLDSGTEAAIEDLADQVVADVQAEMSRAEENPVFAELRAKLTEPEFLAKLAYSHGIDEQIVESAIDYLKSRADGELAARGFIADFNGSDRKEAGYTESALLLISTHHIERNKINKITPYVNERTEVANRMATAEKARLAVENPDSALITLLTDFIKTNMGYGAEESDQEELAVLVSDTLMSIGLQKNSAELGRKITIALSDPENHEETVQKLLNASETVLDAYLMRNEILAGLKNGTFSLADDASRAELLEHARNLLDPEKDAKTVTFINDLLEGKDVYFSSEECATLQQVLTDNVLTNYYKDIDDTLASISTENLEAAADAEILEQPAAETAEPRETPVDRLKKSVAAIKALAENIAETDARTRLDDALIVYEQDLEDFASVDLEDTDDTVLRNYAFSRKNLDESHTHLHDTVKETLADENIDEALHAVFGKIYEELERSMPDLIDAFSEQARSFVPYEKSAASILAKTTRGPIRPYWYGNGEVARYLAESLEGYPHNLEVVMGIGHALEANGNLGRYRAAYKNSGENTPYVKAAYDLTKSLLDKTAECLKNGTDFHADPEIYKILGELGEIGTALLPVLAETAETPELEASEAEPETLDDSAADTENTAASDAQPTGITSDEAYKSSIHARMHSLLVTHARNSGGSTSDEEIASLADALIDAFSDKEDGLHAAYSLLDRVLSYRQASDKSHTVEKLHELVVSDLRLIADTSEENAINRAVAIDRAYHYSGVAARAKVAQDVPPPLPDGETQKPAQKSTADEGGVGAIEELRGRLHENVRALMGRTDWPTYLSYIRMLSARSMPKKLGEEGMNFLIDFTDYALAKNNPRYTRYAIETLGQIWFRKHYKNQAHYKQAWKNARYGAWEKHFEALLPEQENPGAASTRRAMYEAISRAGILAGIGQQKSIDDIYRACVSSACGEDRVPDVRLGNLKYLLEYLECINAGENKEASAEDRQAYYKAALDTIVSLGNPEESPAALESIRQTVKAARRDRAENELAHEKSMVSSALDEIFGANQEAREQFDDEALFKQVGPNNLRLLNSYLSDVLASDQEQKADTIAHLTAITNGNDQQRADAFAAIRQYLAEMAQRAREENDLPRNIRRHSDAQRGTENRADAADHRGRIEPGFTRGPANSRDEGAAEEATVESADVASLDRARDDRRLDGDLDLRRPPRPTVGEDINPVYAYVAGKWPSVKQGAMTVLRAAGRRWPTIAIGMGTGFYVKGALVASFATPFGPFAATIAAGALVGYFIGGQINHHYLRSIDANEDYREGRLGFWRNRGVELIAGFGAVGKFLGHSIKVYETDAEGKKNVAKGLAKNTLLAPIAAPVSILVVTGLAAFKTYQDNKGEKIGFWNRIRETFGNRKHFDISDGMHGEMLKGVIGGAIGAGIGAGLHELDKSLLDGGFRNLVGSAASLAGEKLDQLADTLYVKDGFSVASNFAAPKLHALGEALKPWLPTIPSKADILRLFGGEDAGPARITHPDHVDDTVVTIPDPKDHLLSGTELPRGALDGTFDRTFPDGHPLAGDVHRYFKLPDSDGYLVRVVPADGEPTYYKVGDKTLESLRSGTPIDPTKVFVESTVDGDRLRLFPNGDLETITIKDAPPGYGERYVRIFKPEGGAEVREIVTPDGKGGFRELTEFESRADEIVQAEGDGAKLAAFLEGSEAWSSMKARVQELIDGKVLKGADARLFQRLIETAESGKPDAWRALNDLRANLSEGGVMDGNFVRRIPGMAIERTRAGSTTIALMQDIQKFSEVFSSEEHGLTTRGAKLNLRMSDAALENKDVTGREFGAKGSPSHEIDPVNTVVRTPGSIDLLERLNAKGYLITKVGGHLEVTGIKTTRIPAFFDNPIENLSRNFGELVNPTPTVRLHGVYASQTIGEAARLWQLHMIEAGNSPQQINAWTDGFNRGGAAATTDLFRKMEDLFRAGNGKLSADELKFLRAFSTEARTTAGLKLAIR